MARYRWEGEDGVTLNVIDHPGDDVTAPTSLVVRTGQIYELEDAQFPHDAGVPGDGGRASAPIIPPGLELVD